jgi:ribonuclease Y
MNPFLTILLFAIALALGGAAGVFMPSPGDKFDQNAEKKRVEEAKIKAKEIEEDSQQKVVELAAALIREEQSLQENTEHLEHVIEEKQGILTRREDRNKVVHEQADQLKEELKKLTQEKEDLTRSTLTKLTESAGMNEEQALEDVRQTLKAIIEKNKEKRFSAELEEYEEEIMRHAKAVLSIVIQRLGVQSSVDRNSTAIKIKDDKFKGMLIGKGGTNIAYLETLLPVSVIFNLGDPQTIYVGGVNLLRRNIAKGAIQKLERIARKKGKITHADIKKTVEDTEVEIMRICDTKGKWALKQMNLDPSQVPKELVNYTGRMYFRTSYGQNIIHHSLEMAYAARLISEIIDIDVNVAMQAAFYHDIGKAIDHDVGGSHDDLSKEILDRHNYDPRIVHAAYAHHDKVPCLAPEDFIVKAVDAISGGRPGARMETVTNYFERMKQLADCANTFKGVRKVSTMSAGREVRVDVDHQNITDKDMENLADNIANKISDEVSFPGIIKVNLIRKTRSVDYAREKQRSYK